jgi:hypothetical protein
MWFELEPAYGRDYKTKKEVTDAFLAGKDFSGDYQLGFKPVNIADIPKPCTVQLRYARKMKFAVVKVAAGSPRQNPGAAVDVGDRVRWQTMILQAIRGPYIRRRATQRSFTVSGIERHGRTATVHMLDAKGHSWMTDADNVRKI